VPGAIGLTSSQASQRPGSGDVAGSGVGEFAVHLDNFAGPFDLLLRLIAKHELDITEVALSQVTDEFIAYVKEAGAGGDLDHSSAFLVVAATLLDLKAARLLPGGDVEDEEDIALLEARDLLFARLMQYRAYKQVAALLAERIDREAQRFPAVAIVDDRFAAALPEVLIGLGPAEFAAVAARVLTPRPQPELGLAHLHVPTVSVSAQATLLVPRLRRAGRATFRSLCVDSPDTLTTVARFLAILELYRDGVVELQQASSYAQLCVVWTGEPDGAVSVSSEYDGEADLPTVPRGAGTGGAEDEAAG